MTAYQALGEEYVESKLVDLTLTGKSIEEAREVLKKEAQKKISVLKKKLPPRLYNGFVADGYSADEMLDYAVYSEEKKKKEKTAAEEKAYADKVAYAKKEFKKEYSGTDFKSRLDRGVGRTLTEINVLAHKAVGAKPEPERLGFLAADDEISGDFEKMNRTPQQQKTYKEKEKAYEASEGTVDTVFIKKFY